MEDLNLSIQACQRVLAAIHVSAGKIPPLPLEIKDKLDAVKGKGLLAYQWNNTADKEHTVQRCYLLFLDMEDKLNLCLFQKVDNSPRTIEFLQKDLTASHQPILKFLKQMNLDQNNWLWWDGLKGPPFKWRIIEGLKIYGIISKVKKISFASTKKKANEIFENFLNQVEKINGKDFDEWWKEKEKDKLWKIEDFDNELVTFLLSSWMFEDKKILAFKDFRESKLKVKYGRSRIRKFLKNKLENWINENVIKTSEIFKQAGFKEWKNL